MDVPRIPLAAGLSLLFGIAAWGLLRGGPAPRSPWRDVLAGTAAFLSALFALKIPALVGRAPGLLRNDFLYPLWARWETGAAWWWLLPAAFVGGAVLEGWRRGIWHRLPRPAFLAGLAAAAIGIWTCLALTNGGWPEGLVAPFLRDADYLSDVAKFESLASILPEYVDKQPAVSLHGKTHPPGAVLLLTVLHRALGGSTAAIAWAVVAIGAAGLVTVHRLASRVLGEDEARSACLVWAFFPAVLLYGATCMDMVFAVPLVGALASAASWKDGEPASRALRRGAVTGVWLAAGFFFTFSTAIAAVAIALLARRRLVALAAAAGVSAGLLLLLRPLAGFDIVACLRTAMVLDAADAPAFHSARYYALTRLMGVLDFLLLAGIAAAPAWIGFLSRSEDGARPARALGRAAAAAGLLFLAAGAFKIGETGRIGLFLMPVVAVGVASGRPAIAPAVAWVGLAQTLLFEHFLDTRW